MKQMNYFLGKIGLQAFFLSFITLGSQVLAQNTVSNYGDGSDGSLTVNSGTKYTDNVRANVKYFDYSPTSTGLRMVLDPNHEHGSFSDGDMVMVVDMKPKTGNGCDNRNYMIFELLGVGTNSQTQDTELQFWYGSQKVNDFIWNIDVNNTGLQGWVAPAHDQLQVIKIPQYQDVTIGKDGKLTCHEWNGYTGGILSFWVQDGSSLTFDGDGGGYGKITTTGKGFKGTQGGKGGPPASHVGSGGEGADGGRLNDGYDAAPNSEATIESPQPDWIKYFNCSNKTEAKGGRGGFATPSIWGEDGENPKTATDHCRSDRSNKVIMPGGGGSGGHGGRGAGAGGNGGGGGAGYYYQGSNNATQQNMPLDGEDGGAPKNVPKGGDGGDGGDGAGAIFIRAANIEFVNPVQSNNPLFIANGTAGEDGQSVNTNAAGGDGGDGGKGGDGKCDKIKDKLYPAGSGGAGGYGGNGPDGGWGGDGGHSSNIWLFHASQAPVIDEDQHLASIGGDHGEGGDGGDRGENGDDGPMGKSIDYTNCSPANCQGQEYLDYEVVRRTRSGPATVRPCNCHKAICQLSRMEPAGTDEDGNIKFVNPNQEEYQNYCIVEDGVLKCYNINDDESTKGSGKLVKNLTTCDGGCASFYQDLAENGFTKNGSCQFNPNRGATISITSDGEEYTFSIEKDAWVNSSGEEVCETEGDCSFYVKGVVGNPGVPGVSLGNIGGEEGSPEVFVDFDKVAEISWDKTIRLQPNVSGTDSEINKGSYSVKIFPNPTTKDLKLKTRFNSDVNGLKLTIISNNGKVAYTAEKEVNKGVNEFRLSTKDLSAGKYNLRIVGDNIERTIPFVKQ